MQQLQLLVLDHLPRLSLVWVPSGPALELSSVIAARTQHQNDLLILPSSFQVLVSSRRRTSLLLHEDRELAYDQDLEVSWH